MSVVIGNVVYGILFLCGQVGKRIPYSLAWVFGWVFAFLFAVFAPSRVSIAWQNIALVFPEKSRKERWHILTRSFLNMGLCMWEWLWFPAMTPDDIRKRVTITNETLSDLIAKHGGLILTSHMGNWEFMAAYGAQNFVPMAILYRYFRQRWVEVLWQKARKKHGIEMISESRSAFQVMRRLGQKYAIGIMLDQHMAPPEGIVATFFGREVGAMPALATLQMRTHQYVFPVLCYRDWKTGKFTVVIDGKINPETRRLEEYQSQIHEATSKYLSYLEKWIRQYPEQWLWVHRRFKYSYDYSRKKEIPRGEKV